jgi:hypothetical protein
MPKRVEIGGKKYWQFPELPYDVSDQIRQIYNWYMRTDPQTGELADVTQWATYPNHATPANLAPLLRLLRTIADRNAERLEADLPQGIWYEVPRMRRENDGFRTRLGFYQDRIDELLDTDPNVNVGDQTENAKQLSRLVVEPLFFGWYPNDVWPFSEQGPPFASQTEQSVLDLYLPFSIANQATVSKAALDQAWEDFKTDLQDRFNAVVPVIPALTILPFALVGALALAGYMRARG